MWDSSHIHTINQIGVSQSPPLKCLTSSLWPTLWGNVFEPTWGYQIGSDIICNDPRKSANYICAIPQKDQSQLRLLVVVNKAQIYSVNTRCGTYHTPTHITQSIKLGHHKSRLTQYYQSNQQVHIILRFQLTLFRTIEVKFGLATGGKWTSEHDVFQDVCVCVCVCV